MSMLKRFIPRPLYEATRRAVERVPRTVSLALVWVGAAALLVSCALMVYLAAVLLARSAVWFFL